MLGDSTLWYVWVNEPWLFTLALRFRVCWFFLKFVYHRRRLSELDPSQRQCGTADHAASPGDLADLAQLQEVLTNSIAIWHIQGFFLGIETLEAAKDDMQDLLLSPKPLNTRQLVILIGVYQHGTLPPWDIPSCKLSYLNSLLPIKWPISKYNLNARVLRLNCRRIPDLTLHNCLELMTGGLGFLGIALYYSTWTTYISRVNTAGNWGKWQMVI